MDFYVAPLRIIKKTASSSERLRESDVEELAPGSIPRRNSSISSDAWFTSVSTPTESSFDISSTPPLDTRQASLEVRKVRKDFDKSRSWPRKMIPSQRQPDQPARTSFEGALYLTDAHPETKSHDSEQVTNSTPSQRTPHKLFHFLHTFDKRFSSLPSHGLSKRILTHSQPTYPVNRNSQFLESGFTMQACPSPVTILKMYLQPERFTHNSKGTEFYVRITISADVGSASEVASDFTNYIDNVVLLNIRSKSEMDKVLGMAQIVIDALKPGDSLLIACINSERNSRVDVLMPLCQGPNVDLRRLASGQISLGRPLWKGVSDGNVINEAIYSVSEMLTCVSRVRHVFLVSIECDSSVGITGHFAVGVSTVTMSERHEIEFSARLSWHIRCEMATNNTIDASSLRPKVDKSIRLIRSALAPGSISNLQLKLIPGTGCTIKSHGKVTMDLLRPGESWHLFARVKALNGSQIDRLEEGIKSLLRCSDIEEDQDGAVLLAKLSFKHSLLPSCSSVLSKSCHISEK